MVLRAKQVNRFRKRIGERLYEADLGLSRALMMDLQALAMGNNGGPDIVMGQPPPHCPGLAQHPDRSIAGHASDEMQPAGGEGQRCGEQGERGGGQARAPDAPVGLSWGTPF